MSDKPSYSIGCGGGTLGLLGLVFAVCKLFGVIDWSWWIVLMPFYLPAAIGISVFLVFIILWVIANMDSPRY